MITGTSEDLAVLLHRMILYSFGLWVIGSRALMSIVAVVACGDNDSCRGRSPGPIPRDVRSLGATGGQVVETWRYCAMRAYKAADVEKKERLAISVLLAMWSAYPVLLGRRKSRK